MLKNVKQTGATLSLKREVIPPDALRRFSTVETGAVAICRRRRECELTSPARNRYIVKDASRGVSRNAPTQFRETPLLVSRNSTDR
ncbi:MAG: hypothetical protein D6680_20645 [Cyanobacteria bacterium J007]|nr:MAG: hypothetical protein D6680_20645 [Cyanobacteria bacterium J007]